MWWKYPKNESGISGSLNLFNHMGRKEKYNVLMRVSNSKNNWLDLLLDIYTKSQIKLDKETVNQVIEYCQKEKNQNADKWKQFL